MHTLASHACCLKLQTKAQNPQLNFVQFSNRGGRMLHSKNKFFLAVITITNSCLTIYIHQRQSKNQTPGYGPSLEDIKLFFYRIATIIMFILKVKAILVTLLALTARTYQSNDCLPGCQTCSVYLYYVFCTRCLPQRYMDQNTGQCFCLPGTYDSGGSCNSCPNYCLTCNQYSCTSCAQDKSYRNGSCICKNGNGIDENGNCLTTTSLGIGSIIGISLGAAAGFMCVFTIVIYLLRNRNVGVFQRREYIPEHLPSPNAVALEIQLDLENSSAYGTILQSKLQKNFSFKPEICSICLEESPYCMTECGHYFHEHCIGEWMHKRHNCPNCNHSISRMKLVKWCNSCKSQLIHPQFSQFYRVGSSRNPPSQEIPIFWPTCSKCQGFGELIDLKAAK